MKAKTPLGKKVAAELHLEKWIARLLRAAKEVEKARRKIKYYERNAIPRKEERRKTRVKNPKQHLWQTSNNGSEQ